MFWGGGGGSGPCSRGLEGQDPVCVFWGGSWHLAVCVWRGQGPLRVFGGGARACACICGGEEPGVCMGGSWYPYVYVKGGPMGESGGGLRIQCSIWGWSWHPNACVSRRPQHLYLGGAQGLLCVFGGVLAPWPLYWGGPQTQCICLGGSLVGRGQGGAVLAVLGAFWAGGAGGCCWGGGGVTLGWGSGSSASPRQGGKLSHGPCRDVPCPQPRVPHHLLYPPRPPFGLGSLLQLHKVEGGAQGTKGGGREPPMPRLCPPSTQGQPRGEQRVRP